MMSPSEPQDTCAANAIDPRRLFAKRKLYDQHVYYHLANHP